MRRWAAAVASLLALTATALVASPGPVAAAGDPIADARAALEEAQAEAAAAHDRYENALADRDRTHTEIQQTEASIQQTQAEIAELERQIEALRVERAELREIVNDRAAALYRSADPAGFLLAFEDSEAYSRRTELVEAALEADVERAHELEALSEQLDQTQDDLDARRAQLDQRKGELDRQRAALDEVVARLDQEKAEFDRKVAEANAALEKAKALGALAALGTPVMGTPVLSAADLAGWYRTTGSQARLGGGLAVDQLAVLFIEEGLVENVRGDIAFAQSYLETGGFSFPGGGQVNSHDNNFAGLGACDSCSTGRRFPTARDGVRAQIQHLRNYADSESRAAGLANPPSPYWYGPDAAANFDGFYAKGWAPVWEMMGRGKWATDPNYAGKVLGIYARMGSYATGG